MQITGANHLGVDAATAWAAFHDRGVLERNIPGAQSVRELGPGRYALTVTAGVASIKGTYDGEAVFSEETAPESFLLSLSGTGGPGTVTADVRVRLSPSDEGGTTLDWTAHATVGGPVGGVGQRMLSGVAKRLATQFFTNVDRDLASSGGQGGGQGAGAEEGMPAPDTGGAARAPLARAGAPTPASADQVVPMLAGAAIALVGVALGARLRRR